jgi:hypothetical protein
MCRGAIWEHAPWRPFGQDSSRDLDSTLLRAAAGTLSEEELALDVGEEIPFSAVPSKLLLPDQATAAPADRR